MYPLLEFFTYSIMPYITLILVITGLIYRFSGWFRGVKIKKYRFNKNIITFIEHIIMDIFLFRSIFRVSKITWFFAVSFHLSIFAILFGHLRPFGIWSKEQLAWLGKPVEQILVETLPTILGVVFTISAFVLLIRRIIYKPTNEVSIIDDYIAILLVLLIGLVGSIMRFMEHLPQYLIIDFLPGITFVLEKTPNETLTLIHILLAQLFLIYLPFGKLFHIVTTPLNIIIAKSLGLEPYTHLDKEDGFSKLDYLEADSCTSCAICTEVCPVYEATNGEYKSYIAINRLVRSIKLKPKLRSTSSIDADMVDDIYLCLLCARCKVFCPSGINTVALGISAREYLGKKNMMPPNYKLAKDSVDKLRNVLGLPNEERGMWNEYSYTPASIMEKGSDYVYFVGCMASFSPAVQDIPVAVNEILTRAGLNYTILAGEEWCCGYPLIIGGMRDGVEELVNHNIEVIKKLGASTVIFSCPSCFLTWRMEYPENGIRLLHHTQLINQLIKDNKIKLGHINAKVTYHDPCDLGRKSGIYIEPREIIKNIPGIEFIELKENREKSLCCGGGGDVEIIDENFPALVGSKVINMADESGVQYLVTACQQCKRTFMKAAKKVGSNIRVVDIAELVLLSMENA